MNFEKENIQLRLSNSSYEDINSYPELGKIRIHKVEELEKNFELDGQVFDLTSSMIRRAFGKNLTDEDIYLHITAPKEVYLLEIGNRLAGMASFNKKTLSGIPSRIIEGIAIDPKFQGKGVFGLMMDVINGDEPIIGLRTQNPRMYRALDKYCSKVYPNKEKTPEAIRAVRNHLAKHLNCEIDQNEIIRKYYGGLFYSEEPKHQVVTNFFKENLGMYLEQGDALLVIGMKNYGKKKDNLSKLPLEKISKQTPYPERMLNIAEEKCREP